MQKRRSNMTLRHYSRSTQASVLPEVIVVCFGWTTGAASSDMNGAYAPRFEDDLDLVGVSDHDHGSVGAAGNHVDAAMAVDDRRQNMTLRLACSMVRTAQQRSGVPARIRHESMTSHAATAVRVE